MSVVRLLWGVVGVFLLLLLLLVVVVVVLDWERWRRLEERARASDCVGIGRSVAAGVAQRVMKLAADAAAAVSV